jgi:cytochrome c-type biogenesis protein CcmH
MRRILGSVWLFLGALVVVVVVVFASAPSTPSVAQRVAGLEALVKCPSCQDISVADSNAASSVAVRQEIAARVKAGESDNTILAALESRYGNDILLSPRGSALDSLLWVIPALVVAGGVVAYLKVARRRS